MISISQVRPGVSMEVTDANGTTVYTNDLMDDISVASVERVLVQAGDGDDVINAVPFNNINIVVNGEGPTASDWLNVLVPGNATVIQ